MPATMTTVDSLLKEIYGPRVENQLQSETVALTRIERTSDGVVETVGGKYVDFPIRVGRNSGIGYRNESEANPTAGQQGYAEVHVGLKKGLGVARFTNEVMQLAEKNYQAFASSMDNEMEYLKDDLSKDSNRVVYGDGTGLMAMITDTAISTSHTVDNAQYLNIGDRVDILTASNGATVQLNILITDINGLTVTFDTSFTGALTAGIFRQGNYGREPSGLGTIVSATTTLFGLAPASQRKWAAVIDAPGADRALSEGLMITMCDNVRINGGKTSVILTSLGVRRAYFNLLTQQRRYTDTKQFAGGFQGLAFNYGSEIPVVEDPDAPPKTMWGLDEDKFKVYRNKPWHWADEDGNVLKWIAGYDVFECYMRQYWQIGVTQRNAQWKAANITEG